MKNKSTLLININLSMNIILALSFLLQTYFNQSLYIILSTFTCLIISIISSGLIRDEIDSKQTLCAQIQQEDKVFEKFNNLLTIYFSYLSRSTTLIKSNFSGSLNSIRGEYFFAVDSIKDQIQVVSNLRHIEPEKIPQQIDELIIGLVDLDKRMLSLTEDIQKEDLISQYMLQLNIANERFNVVCKELIRTLSGLHKSSNPDDFDLTGISDNIEENIIKILKFNDFLDNEGIESGDLDLF